MFFFYQRVESRQKKSAVKESSVKEEDPYGGSTDENTDAEAEEDYPIPELPGTSASYVGVFLSAIHVPLSGTHLSLKV